MAKEKILIIAAHPDDEALGCGGYIAKKAEEGAEIKAVFLTNGVSARDEIGDDEIKARNIALTKSSEILGIHEFYSFDFPDNRLDTVPLIEVIKEVERVIAEFLPNVIITHHLGDLNIDHQIAHKVALTACRPIVGRSVTQIIAFEVLSSTEWTSSSAANQFVPNLFVNITDFMEKKLASLNAYKDEMRESPHSRSLRAVEALATLRGECSGYKYAEGFMIIRQLNN
ncbi:MAG: PIG-L family deacetylase [Rickettsiales bacterium]|jgi:N-acetylglucosamine malate deacetylase 1|nr:PIG-L family deacetylase [Rickettsiales bacterium]